MRVGIYAGTFDPVHPGHIAFALEAMRQCELEKVVFLPERLPRYKRMAIDISHRVALLREVTATNKGLDVMELSSKYFTVAETLPELREIFAGDSLVFLIGSDVVQGSLASWPDVKRLLEEASFAIGVRAEDSPADIQITMQKLYARHNLEQQYALVETEHAALSSSDIRNEEHDGTGMIPAVADYIMRHGLYAS